MKATFLLGSGISIPAKLSSIAQLTSVILAGEGLIVQSDGRVARIGDRARAEYEIREGREKVRRILIFLDWLKAQANSRYAEIAERWVNYEDLAYLAEQISDDLANEYENPALQPFVRNALIDLCGLFSDAAPSKTRNELKKLAGLAVDYIRQVVACLLRQEPSNTIYLQVFAKACQDPYVSEVNLFTLNHDTLLEEFLKMNGVAVIDGLREASNQDGSRRWDPSVFDAPKGERRVNLFKLHGSINWYRWGPISQHQTLYENADRNGRFVGTYKAHDWNDPLYEQVLESEGPRFLAGTFNKILDYNSEIFLELHHRFHRALRDCQTLVVCGYGFGDKGVNTRIVEWRHLPSKPKLLIIDPAEPLKIFQRARGAILREIEVLIDPKKASGGPVIHWKNGLEEYMEITGERIKTWERIRTELQDC